MFVKVFIWIYRQMCALHWTYGDKSIELWGWRWSRLGVDRLGCFSGKKKSPTHTDTTKETLNSFRPGWPSASVCAQSSWWFLSTSATQLHAKAPFLSSWGLTAIQSGFHACLFIPSRTGVWCPTVSGEQETWKPKLTCPLVWIEPHACQWTSLFTEGLGVGCRPGLLVETS